MSYVVAVLGAGNGGQALAGDLSSRGFTVNLWETEKYIENIIPIIENENIINVEDVNENKQVRLNLVGSDIKKIIHNANIVCVCAPSYAIEHITNILATYIDSDQVLIYCPGSTGNALAGVKILKKHNKEINIAEFSTLPFAARIIRPGTIKIFLHASKIYTGVFPGKRTSTIIEKINPLFPDSIVPLESVLESSLNNGNPVTHPVPTLLNASRIGLGIPYFFYQEITPEIAGINERIDQERINICNKLGYRHISGARRLYEIGYAPETASLYEAYKQSVPFSNIEAPKSIYDRYIFEDVGFGLQVLARLGEKLGIRTPITSAVITLASSLVNVDFWTEKNRTLEDMDIADLNKDQIKKFLYYGKS